MYEYVDDFKLAPKQPCIVPWLATSAPNAIRTRNGLSTTGPFAC